MPTRTLWRAMASERRPMRTASATRSIRSTTTTASAVSEETVAPAEAHRDADVGEREGRRVVDPVADHHDRPHAGGLQRADELELLLGRLLGVDAVDADLAPDLLGDGRRSPVAMRHVPDPGARSSATSRARPGAGGRPSRRAPRAGRRRRSAPWRAPAPFSASSSADAGSGTSKPQRASHAALPTATARPSTRPSAPWPGASSTSSGKAEREPAARAACTSASAIECAESWSREAASRERLARARPSKATRARRRARRA